ncbi:hypothetical protein BD324DRAFT_614191 [Kockovaella imperatae]|uniref:RRM domain-containing protein n=1 Tax=Kockovaella imperatae TaxID=4999 RepID=A0A1Y1UND2_9TREE|nr:hypothetical protein BD324DRAFT_614191 [Kockovaella imperatae]ORX39570.1 hypothetical protein BD324DRAFT_614191 [Kockovaella imperatae]
MPPNASRTVFVANIPYDVSEEQLANVFSEVGPVANVEIKFDPQTGRSKGYAFVQYTDEATAFSAVRNLHEVPVNGRNLRVELSTEEPGPRRRVGGPGGGGGDSGPPGGGVIRGGPGAGGAGVGGRRSGGDRDFSPAQGGGGGGGGGGPPGGGYGRRPMEDDYGYGGPGGPGSGPGPGAGAGAGGPPIDLHLIPQGRDVPPGQKATDVISKTLAGIQPGQMQDVMMGMKTLVTTQPDKARQMLMSSPQLAYALFQAMLLMNIVDPAVLQRITPLPPAAAAPPPQSQYPPPPQQSSYPSYPPPGPPAQPSFPPPPQHHQSYPPPQPAYGAPPPGPPGGYGAPPPAATPALSPAVQAQLATLPADQRDMLMQVLTLTPEQINAVDLTQRESIRQLRQQFLGTA